MVLAIAPLALYGSMVLVPLILAVALRFVIVVPTRECIQCERVVPASAFSCRHCGHRYTAEDRELMRLQAKWREREPAAAEPGASASGVSLQPPPRNGVPRVDCASCGGKVAPTALTCRHCGHRYSTGERERMRQEAGIPAHRPGRGRLRI